MLFQWKEGGEGNFIHWRVSCFSGAVLQPELLRFIITNDHHFCHLPLERGEACPEL
jgi:hypothetical protein